MGSPETCPTCGSTDRLVRFCRDTKYVWKRSCGVPCPNDDFHATPTPPAPADDASGAEAVACVAPAHDMAPRIVVEPYGTSCWQVWLHIGAASWTVGDYRRDKDAAERFAEPLRHALRAALAAPDDAVEEARRAFAASGSAWARHQFECPGAAFEGPGAEWFAENDALRIKAIHDHDALLAAERDAALRRENRPASGQGGA